jgi:hypothetical protein
VPNSSDLDRICHALLSLRLELEAHLAHNDSWRALKTAELGAVVAEHLGTDANDDSKKLHRKLMRTSTTYRAYTRLIEAIRILSEASEEFAANSTALGTTADVTLAEPRHDRGTPEAANVTSKPRIKVRATTRVLSDKARAA